LYRGSSHCVAVPAVVAAVAGSTYGGTADFVLRFSAHQRGGEGSVLGGDDSAGFFAHLALARAQVGVISGGEAEVSAVVVGPSESRSDGFGSSNGVLEARVLAAARSPSSILLEVLVALFADTAESRGDGSKGISR